MSEEERLRRRRLASAGVLLAAGVAALALFIFGLAYPPQMRMRGDASQYFVIASQFDSFAAALAYAGDRTAGMPLFEYTVRRVLVLLGGGSRPIDWVNAICMALLAVHLATAWFFAAWAQRCGVLVSHGARLGLFFFLATYPSLLGHTTVPLTETLAMDVVLLAFIAMGAAFERGATGRGFALAGACGALLGFAVLLRPGNLLGVTVALSAGLALLLLAGRRKLALLAVAAVAAIATTAPSAWQCSQKYGTACLQQPLTFDPMLSTQMGLLGARTLWNMGRGMPGEVPTLPDETMATNYYGRCRLTAIAGLDESSLTGCLLSRPLAIPAYAGKKWIGLFDHFRFTPFLEDATPGWLRWLGRAYGSLSWLGLALFMAVAAQALARAGLRRQLGRWFAQYTAPALMAVYCLAMLVQHTAVHVEDRYSFPFIPLCAVTLAALAEKAVCSLRGGAVPQAAAVARRVLLATYCGAAWAVYFVQVIAWDRTPLQ